MVILIGGEKGGTGKSMIATNLAAIHSIQGDDALLLDTDKQATATYWAINRDENESLVKGPYRSENRGKNPSRAWGKHSAQTDQSFRRKVTTHSAAL